MPEPVLTTRNPIFHESAEGGIRHSPAEPYSKELAKWEMRPLADGSVTQQMIDNARARGEHHGAFEYQEYPKAMLRAEQTPNGIRLVETRSAQDANEERNLLSRGFRMKADDALAAVEEANFDAAEAAANRAFHDRRMTATARAEAEAIDASTARHLGDIPAQRLPPKKRGRPAKAAAVTTEG